MDDKDRILDKIRKCLALAASSNEHEAAAAMRQAQKLMELYGIGEADVLAAGASESSAHAGASSKPPKWENYLASTVAHAFGCDLLFSGSYRGGKWIFVGVGARPEVAQYAFAVLFRQLRRSRAAFIVEKCRRLKTINKTRRADLFCLAWVGAVRSKALAMAIPDEETAAIDAFMVKHHPTTELLKPIDRTAKGKMSEKDWDAMLEGTIAGSDANLNHGVAASGGPTLIGG